MVAWYTDINTLYAEYVQRLENADRAFELGLYDTELDLIDHKEKIDRWYNDMYDEMQSRVAA